MARTRKLQTSFIAGELSPELSFRRDTAQYNAGALSLRNCRLLVGGGFKRRPGSRWLSVLAGDARLTEFVVNRSTRYLLAFSDGRMDAFLPDGTPAGGLTGCPWTGDRWQTFGWVQQSDTMFITHSEMGLYVLRRTGASSWSIEPYAFATGANGQTKQPYLKLAPPAATLTPSARTGNITLTLSAGWWATGHVGQKVRYGGREILVTGIASPTVATGTVIEELAPTTDIALESLDGFRVGDIVEGPDSAAKGVIVSMSAGETFTVKVVQVNRLNSFNNEETLVGPTAQSKITAVAASPTLGALTEWDEALFTPMNGYPGCVALHRNRLCFGGHPLVGNALITSRIDAYDDFDVGEGADAEAIFVLIGDGNAAVITHLVSTEQLLLLTDAGPYYVPEGPQLPFRPSSIDFQRFGSQWPAADCRPHIFDDGVLMVSGSLAIMLRPTGNSSNRQWEAEEVSLLSSHLMNLPTDAAVTENYAGGPERYCLFTNADGTLAVMMLVQKQEIRCFTPWDTAGQYRSIAALSGDIYAVVRRVIGGATVHVLERFEDGLTLDAAGDYVDLAGVPARYGSTPVNVLFSTYHLGKTPIADPPIGPFVVGLDYILRAETFPPYLDSIPAGGAGRAMRVTEVVVHVLSSARFALQGLELTAYQVSDDVLQPPPLRSGAMTFRPLGWRKDPTFAITQADPLPLTVLGISMEVAF